MTLLWHTWVHRQGSASRMWQSWCQVCRWHSEMSRHEDDVTKAAAEHCREANGEPVTDEEQAA